MLRRCWLRFRWKMRCSVSLRILSSGMMLGDGAGGSIGDGSGGGDEADGSREELCGIVHTFQSMQ